MYINSAISIKDTIGSASLYRPIGWYSTDWQDCHEQDQVGKEKHDNHLYESSLAQYKSWNKTRMSNYE